MGGPDRTSGRSGPSLRKEMTACQLSACLNLNRPKRRGDANDCKQLQLSSALQGQVNDSTCTPGEHPSSAAKLFSPAVSTRTSSHVSSSGRDSYGTSFWKAVTRESDRSAASTLHCDFSLVLKETPPQIQNPRIQCCKDCANLTALSIGPTRDFWNPFASSIRS